MPFTFLICVAFIIGLVVTACWVFHILILKLFDKVVGDKIIEWSKVVGVIIIFGAILKLGFDR